MADTSQLSPELVKLLIETDEGDPDLEQLKKQMGTAEALRDRAIEPDRARNIFGVAAQGLAGYGAGKFQGEYADKMRPFHQRRQKSRAGLFDAMFPKGGPSALDQQLAVQASPTLGNMGTPGQIPDPYQP